MFTRKRVTSTLVLLALLISVMTYFVSSKQMSPSGGQAVNQVIASLGAAWTTLTAQQSVQASVNPQFPNMAPDKIAKLREKAGLAGGILGLYLNKNCKNDRSVHPWLHNYFMQDIKGHAKEPHTDFFGAWMKAQDDLVNKGCFGEGRATTAYYVLAEINKYVINKLRWVRGAKLKTD